MPLCLLRPLRNFPALGLITAMHSAIEVRPLANLPSFSRAEEDVFWLPQGEARMLRSWDLLLAALSCSLITILGKLRLCSSTAPELAA